VKLNKIAAIGVGVLMGITTLAGAMAADLKEYPSPFVASGKLNAIMVIGAHAQPIDNVGVTNIATSLQYVSTTAVSGSTDVSISEGVKIEKTGNAFNYFDALVDVQDTPLDSTDLPEILADGEYQDDSGNSETYTQTLSLDPTAADTILLTFDQPEDMKADTYLELLDGEDVYTYTLEMDDAVAWDVESDLESTTIEIQGNMYTITDVKEDGSGDITDMTLMAGETTRWLTQAEPFTVNKGGKSYTVTVVDVDEAATKCGVDVDGEMKWIDVDKTKDFGDLTIGVTDAVAVHEQAQNKDICELNIGATELKITDGASEIKVNSVELDGSSSTIDDDPAGNLWEGLTLTYNAQDDVYLKAGESWTDPMLGNFKILYSGVTRSDEKINFTTSGSKKANLKFVNNDGKDVVIPYIYDESGDAGVGSDEILLGTDYDNLLLMDGQTWTDPDNKDVEGTQFLFVTTGGEAHVLEITNVNDVDQKLDIKDLTYGTSYTNKDFSTGTIALGSLGTAALTFTDVGGDGDYDRITIGDNMKWTDNTAGMETKNSASIEVAAEGMGEAPGAGTLYSGGFLGNSGFYMVENNDGSQDRIYTVTDMEYDTTDDELQIAQPSDGAWDAGALALNWVDASEGDSDNQMAASEVGTIFTYDDKDMKSLLIAHPEADAKGNVFVAPLAGEAVSTSTGSVVVNKIDVGATKLDSEVADVKAQNSIVVGGPCVNEAAADLMGNPADCTAGFEAGKAVVKLFTNGQNVAMLVAGYSGEDTRAASRVVANYEDYANFEGTELVVTTATETVTKVA
jgi:hypothetical protein